MSEEDLDDILADPDRVVTFDPLFYPICARCLRAWTLSRSRGVWAWHQDCDHKTAGVRLMQT